MTSNELSLNVLSEDERAEIEANIVDFALEKFFNNVLDCLSVNENEKCFRL